MRKIKILLVLIFLFISIGAVSAEGNFTALQDDINSGTDSIDINQDYSYDNMSDYGLNSGILINKSDFTIDGKGHTIDGSNQARIFNITGNNITISNIILINGNMTGNIGGALYSFGSIILNNVTFKDNTALMGGAIYAEGKTEIKNAVFVNNTAKRGGAIFTNGNSNQICCLFENNSANNGGAVYFNKGIKNSIINSTFNGNNAIRAGAAIFIMGSASNNTFTSEFNGNVAKEASGGGIFFYKTAENNRIESIFTNNTAAYGGGMFFLSESNSNEIFSDFKNNIAISCGGAIFFFNKTNRNSFKGNYINNTAKGLIVSYNANGGAITFKDTSKNCIFECDFINNTARLNGGAVNYRKTPYNITFKGNFIANNAKSGGGLNFFDEFDNITFSCNFIANNATKGGAIAINKEINNESTIYPDHNATVANCNFTDNRAEEGGAIFASHLYCENSNFDNNTATRGGAIYAIEKTAINNAIFTRNHAKSGGAIIAENNITITNATLKNNEANLYGGAITTMGDATIDNATLNNNQAERGGAIYVLGKATINNIISSNNKANELGSSLYGDGAEIILKNGILKNENSPWSLIFLEKSLISIENTSFVNLTSEYATAIYLSNSSGKIRNSNFVNLSAFKSGGAIGIKELRDEMTIENCNFINVKSQKNGGAIFAEVADGTKYTAKCINIFNTTFIDCNSGFGGAILQLNGILNIEDSKFNNNNAAISGGAIYTALTEFNLKNSEFNNNSAFENGGASYVELTNFTVENVVFIGNKVENSTILSPNTIFAYDSSPYIKNSFFNNPKYSLSSIFTVDYLDENNTVNNDEFNWENKIYPQVVVNEGVKIDVINNGINVTKLPVRFDLREWGWDSPVKNQFTKGYCWAFSIISSLESALLKATDVEYDFSENNLGNNEIIYSKYGSTEYAEGGSQTLTLGYILSWLGPVPEDYDIYDEIGKVSDVMDINKIRVQDAILIPANKTADYINTNETNNLIKQAILKYGSVVVNYFGEGSTYNSTSLYHNDTYVSTHAVSLVGWDDNYSKNNFNITPPGDGAWILKNSWGDEAGINGYQYISYYDTSLMSPDEDATNETAYAIAFIIENTENYKYNYQTDLRGLRGMDKNYTFYSNEYTAVANNLLGAVGTYFNDSGIDYELKIYVNGELKITQNGTSDFPGFKTIKLNEYVPVKENDVFKVVFKNNMVPYQFKSRQHYMANTSLISADGVNWIDSAALNRTSCLKVYAFDLPIYTNDLVKIYKNDSKFEAVIDVANETVTFEINGMNYTRTSDENGAASIAINLNPGNYTIKTTFNGTTVENKITVLPTLIAEDLVKYYRNESQFFISLIDGEGKSVSGVNITMNINGVFYNRTTNENGTAKLNINLEPGKYILTAIDPLTGLQMSYNITVLPVLIANDLEMHFQDGSTFNALVLNGQGTPLANVAVTFNINGVFYTRYTNSSGIAKLNINLMAGEYIITSMYENGATTANKITIRS